MKRLLTIFALLSLLPLPLRSQQTYPAGTAFTETFGNTTTNPQPCWSGASAGIQSQCVQTKTVTQGSSQTIVTAPTGYGFTSTNVMSLPALATIDELEDYGTFPVIPANSSFVFTAVMGVSAYDTGFNALVELYGASTSNLEAWFGEHTTGFYFNNQNACVATPAAAHTLTITGNGTTLAFKIDGVTCGTAIADPGNVGLQIRYLGLTLSTVYIQSVTLTVTGVNGSWPPSQFSDWAGQSGTVTAANLAAGTHCGNVVPSGWTQLTTTGVSFAFASVTTPLMPTWSICGAPYTNNSNVVMQMSVTTGASAGGSWQEQLQGSTYTTAIIGFFFEFSANFDDCDFASLGGGSSNKINNVQVHNFSGVEKIIAESDNGGTSNTLDVAVVPNTWYYLTWEITSAGTADAISLYATTAAGVGSQLATTTFPNTDKPNVGTPLYMNLGKTGNETQTESGTINYSGVVLNYANASFPLLPPSASGCAAFMTLFGVGAGC